jgi:hypothetical protein
VWRRRSLSVGQCRIASGVVLFAALFSPFFGEETRMVSGHCEGGCLFEDPCRSVISHV